MLSPVLTSVPAIDPSARRALLAGVIVSLSAAEQHPPIRYTVTDNWRTC
jgi:hypothetical protein